MHMKTHITSYILDPVLISKILMTCWGKKRIL